MTQRYEATEEALLAVTLRKETSNRTTVRNVRACGGGAAGEAAATGRGETRKLNVGANQEAGKFR